MTIEYNNGKTAKLIKDVLHIMVVDTYVIALLSNGRELSISLANIESIIDDKILESEVINND
jgi:hypothetical protein